LEPEANAMAPRQPFEEEKITALATFAKYLAEVTMATELLVVIGIAQLLIAVIDQYNKRR